MTIAIGLIFFMLFLFYRAELRRQMQKLTDELYTKDVAFSKTIKDLGTIITSQQVYVKQLESFAQISREKVNELADVFATSEMTDEEHAGIIMFQKIDKAIKAVDKLDPNSQIAKELKELLQ